MKDWFLLLRWSWRDLRKYWVKVVAIALIIGIGTGAYAGLKSSTTWRRDSMTASMEQLNMYDVRFELIGDGSLPEGELLEVVAGIDHTASVTDAVERLVRPTQVDASTGDSSLLVPGELVGVELATGGPSVGAWDVAVGSGLTAADSGLPVVLLEYGFITHNDLPDSGTITVSGNEVLQYRGGAMTPEFFMVVPENTMSFSLGTYAGVFTSLATAQDLAGFPGVVNDLVIDVADDADRQVVAKEIEDAVAALGVGVEVTMKEDDPSYRVLFEDVDNDEENFTVFAVMIFLGAVLGAFNLITRLSEAQRREIGIGMALGVPPRKIALRPLLVGAQIALLGVVLGVAMGSLIGNVMRSFMTEILPLPVWITDFQWSLFVGVAIAGFIIPFLAAAYPVWRAVRVKPIEAIRTGHLAARGGGLAPLLKKIPLPGDTFAQMPFRNLMRAPRRAILTTLGIAAVIAVLVGFLGSIDSMLAAIDRGSAAIEGDSPDRLVVTLEGVRPADDPTMEEVTAAASVGEIQPVLQIGARVSGDEDVDLVLEVLDLDNGIWRPAYVDGAPANADGLVLAEVAARDLGVSVGDTVMLIHPVRTGETTFGLAQTGVVVSALHTNPFRFAAYMDDSALSLFNAEGAANVLYVEPAAGYDSTAVQRDLLGMDGVASAQRAATGADDLDDLMAQFIGILQAIAFFVLMLAVLMAFNSASIGFEERQREHATMFAYGVRVRKALRMAIVENTVIGVAATAIGFAGGLWMIWYVVNVTMRETMPDIGLAVEVAPTTLVTVVVLGIMAVAIAPVFTLRRMRRMDLPGTLRVME